jgi:3-hydroxybutyryl-CoA dehydratase
MTTGIKYLPAVVKTITREQLKQYAAASGDHNPLHLDDRFAETTQFGGIIAHGMLTLAFISEMMLAAFGRCWLESGSLKVRFKGAAYLGDRVETWGQVTREMRQEMQKEAQQGTQLHVICSVGARDCRSRREIISGSATVSINL